MRVVVFVAIIISVLALAGYYLGSRLISGSIWAREHRSIVWAAISLFVVLEILWQFVYRAYPAQFARPHILNWFIFTLLGVFVCAVFYSFFAHVLLGIWRVIVGPPESIDLERRAFFSVGTVALTSAIAGVTQAAKGPKIYDIDIPLRDLPEQFEGFKIVQISDLHVGPTIGRHYTQKVVEMTNALDPDVIALTGDFADGDVAHLRSALQPLAQLRAQHGVLFVTGNHEYYWGVEEWLAEYRRMGMRVLLNEHILLRHNGSEIVIAGVTDYTAVQMEPSHASDPRKALQGAPTNTIKILLAHQPASYEEAHKAGFDLQLSGHTHGGQFFPWSLVVRLVQKYYRGLNRHENMWVYVNRGTGYWGPPLRFTIPPEITLIRLRRQPA